MSWVHIHLALSHVPVIGLLIVLLLLVVARRRRSTELMRVSYGLLVVLAAASVVVYLTGEPAEELIENLPGFSEALVERHEEVALIATIGFGVLGLVALVGLIRFRSPRIAPAWYDRGVLLLALLMGGVMAWTANLGGQIRHSEIRADRGATLDRTVE
jgi:glucan phosphoethanolaminetransferase (alkaline phosphatase superfamily)